MRSSSARLFASGGVSAQFGRLARNFLDFTRVVARLDLGLTSQALAQPAPSGGASAASSSGGAGAPLAGLSGSPFASRRSWSASALAGGAAVGGGGSAAAPCAAAAPRHPALALDHRGSWHALTVEACQQLVGPLRLCAEARFALDSDTPWPGLRPMDAATPAAALRHVAGARRRH